MRFNAVAVPAPAAYYDVAWLGWYQVVVQSRRREWWVGWANLAQRRISGASC